MEEEALKLDINFIECHSQLDKRPFYEKLGYHVVDGNIFIEDGIDHIKMGKSLPWTLINHAILCNLTLLSQKKGSNGTLKKKRPWLDSEQIEPLSESRSYRA